MDQLVETLFEGFFDDPLFGYAFERPERRARVLPPLFAGLLRHAQRHGGVVAAGDGAAVAAWVPASKMSVRVLDAARSRMLTLPLRAGWRAWNRFSRYEHEADVRTRREHGTDFAYLWVVAARSSRRGEGLGRRVLEQAQHDMRVKGHRACVLRTQQPRNVGLYRHLGFEQTCRFTPQGSQLETFIFRRSLPGATVMATPRASV